MTIEERVNEANAKVLEIMTKGHPVWVDVRPAIDVIPGMTKNTILMPGPSIEVERLTPPLRTSVCGAAIHEGLARTREEAWAMVERGEIVVASSQTYNTGNAACMVTSASMSLWWRTKPTAAEAMLPFTPVEIPSVCDGACMTKKLSGI